jgi:ferredoxin-thioredoxin reductase catalytic subunit
LNPGNSSSPGRKDIINIESDLEELKQRVSAFCREAGYLLSPDADAIFRDMLNMKQLAGDFYCPCQTQRGPETVCVCQSVRNGLVELVGACFCNLILSGNKHKE